MEEFKYGKLTIKMLEDIIKDITDTDRKFVLTPLTPAMAEGLHKAIDEEIRKRDITIKNMKK